MQFALTSRAKVALGARVAPILSLIPQAELPPGQPMGGVGWELGPENQLARET